jgi:hypothetical protein
MKCPHCIDKLMKKAMIRDVEVDYCPKCHGIWLDKDELDQLCGLVY